MLVLVSLPLHFGTHSCDRDDLEFHIRGIK